MVCFDVGAALSGAAGDWQENTSALKQGSSTLQNDPLSMRQSYTQRSWGD
ncbi:MAG TPA: hypothetical protein VJV79_05730 [Polyangiaceae bacterium]|nr:hypothetical protein [Polyangiaceae bacterium]